MAAFDELLALFVAISGGAAWVINLFCAFNEVRL